jgi:hypothetical protein
MMNSRVAYTYINMYLNNMKNNKNAGDKSFCAVISRMITYTIYMKLQKYIHYLGREDLPDPSIIPIFIYKLQIK